MYYLCSENKGADQLRGYREADLRLCFRVCKSRFSHDAAHLYILLINVKMSTFVVILTFMSRKDFMLSRVEHGNSLDNVRA